MEDLLNHEKEFKYARWPSFTNARKRVCREGVSVLVEHPAFVGRIAYIKVREAYLVFRKKGEVEKVRVEGALPP